MKNNETLQQDVEDAIKWEPSLHAAEIGVIVKNGVVTLTGTVDSYTKKLEAEHAIRNVAGVQAVVQKIDVKLSSSAVKTDEDIATAALSALRNNWSVPDRDIRVKVENGWLYLDGNLQWNYQRDAAERSVEDLTGVKGVINNLTIKADSHDKVEQKLVEDALKRHWSINADHIRVKVSGTNVTLTGTVGSLYQKKEAGRIAWKTPGVYSVDNKLEVEYDYALA